jgi:GTPase SAR1 family protein
MNMNIIRRKIALIGLDGVGKSTFVNNFLRARPVPSDAYHWFFVLPLVDSVGVFDIYAYDKFEEVKIKPDFYILMYDVTNKASLEYLLDFEAMKPAILVGNKSDAYGASTMSQELHAKTEALLAKNDMLGKKFISVVHDSGVDEVMDRVLFALFGQKVPSLLQMIRDKKVMGVAVHED